MEVSLLVRKLSRIESLDLVIGAKILANGGGGSEEKAIELINSAYNSGQKFRMASLDEFQQDDQICIVGMVGGGITEEEKAVVKDLSINVRDPMVTAVKDLEEFMNITFKGFVDILNSGTRRDDLLQPEEVLNKVWILQKFLGTMNTVEGMEFLINKLKKYKTNEEFLESINKKNGNGQ